MAEVWVGVGFGTAATAADIARAVTEVAGEHLILALATASTKRGSPALADAAASLGAPVVTFTLDELSGIRVPTPSLRVALETGSASVAEAAAVLASGGGPLIVAKTVRNSVTVAIARKVLAAPTTFADEMECE